MFCLIDGARTDINIWGQRKDESKDNEEALETNQISSTRDSSSPLK